MITIFGSGGGQLPTLNPEPSSETSREGAVSPTLVVDEDSHDNNNRYSHCQQKSLPTHFPISKDIYEITHRPEKILVMVSLPVIPIALRKPSLVKTP